MSINDFNINVPWCSLFVIARMELFIQKNLYKFLKYIYIPQIQNKEEMDEQTYIRPIRGIQLGLPLRQTGGCKPLDIHPVSVSAN